MAVSIIFLLSFAVALKHQFSVVSSHGMIISPLPRGALNGKLKWTEKMVDKDGTTETDYMAHFPSGDKESAPGSGHRSQMARYKRLNKPWTKFNPTDQSFLWRVGVCGDLRNGPKSRDHLRGGKYYNLGMRSATYTQGDEIDIELSINVHHNGFMELYVCDVSKCGGEISESCFKQTGLKRACYQLERASNAKCDSGNSLQCGPKDPNYPGRWYFPCERNARRGKNGQMRFGSGNIKYKLPPNLYCEHCVMHWYWTSANNCNPPGVTNYFTGLNRPTKWGKCPGQGGARGGYSRNADCGVRFPEEYNSCSDIQILRRENASMPKKWTPSPSPNRWNRGYVNK